MAEPQDNAFTGYTSPCGPECGLECGPWMQIAPKACPLTDEQRRRLDRLWREYYDEKFSYYDAYVLRERRRDQQRREDNLARQKDHLQHHLQHIDTAFLSRLAARSIPISPRKRFRAWGAEAI